MIELLAPAGDEKSFFAAVNNGADAVYLGLSDFSARKNATNFNAENIGYFVSYAHALGVKVYLAVNTLIKDSEIVDLLKTVSVGYSVGVDAFILQDIYLADILKSNFKDIVLHLSTQAGINNCDGAILAKKMGFDRIILARETNIEEIEKITGIIETEIFVHGALCTCFSGHCYMSAYIGANSGNRGFCKQPCRKEYTLDSKVGGKYPISLSDLNLYDYIEKIKNAGVKSLKIEGRMRSPEYVAAAVSYYRAAIDGKDGNLHNLKRTFNRGDYTKGYVFGEDEKIISDKVQNHLGETVGYVKTVKGDSIAITPNRKNLKGDAFKILSKGNEVGNAVALEDGDVLKFKGRVKVGDTVNITKDSSLSERLFCNTKKKVITVKVEAIENQILSLEADGEKVSSSEILQSAINSGTTKDEIIKNLFRTDKYPFEIIPQVDVVGNPFIPKSTLNRLRANLYEQLFFKDVKHLKNDFKIEDNTNFYSLNYKGIILNDDYVEVPEGYAFVLRPKDYSKFDEIKRITDSVKTEKYLFVPSFLPQKAKDEVLTLLRLFDGIYADGLNGVKLSCDLSKKLIAGLGLNVFNYIDVKKLKTYTDDIVLSQELSLSEIKKFNKFSGYNFTSGSIRLMELLYCPFGRKCGDCKRNENSFTLTDEAERKFKLIKYKIGGACRFELYNEQILLTQDYENRRFINLVGLDKYNYEKIIKNDREEIKKRLQTTLGNSKRGVY